MSSAKVLSVEALQQFHIEMAQFRVGLLKELESLDLELRRLTQWIEVDAARYWDHENQLIRRKLSEYLSQLSRCMSYVREDERKPCTEEKKQVAKAKERANVCEQKLQVLKAASTHWEARRSRVRPKMQRARDMAESDLVVALNQLLRLTERLEAYRQVASGAFRTENLTADEVTTSQSGTSTSSTEESENLNSPTDDKST